MRFLSEPFQLFWKHRVLLLQTTRNDILIRHAGSVLGMFWLLLYPLMFLGVYAMMYIFIFKVRFHLLETNEYVALIFCGLIPFFGFSEALGTGVSSVVANSNLLKNTLFPIELIPVKAALASQATQIVGTMMLLVVLGSFGKLTPWAVLLPVIWVSQLMFTIGLLWILSSINVLLRDIQNVVPVFILILMMVSPIAYTEDMVPTNLHPFLIINPLYYIITANQDILMLGHNPRGTLWIVIAMGLFFFILGYSFFYRMKKVFTDNV